MAKSTTPRPPSARKPRAPKAAGPKLVVATRAVGHDEIALRAYELFLASGFQHGHDIDHWLQAERELNARRLTSAA
jgi:hypothetical protein